MEIRGRRRCLDCGATWNYFETGGVDCPECGSIRSTSTTEGRQDTSSTELNMEDVVQELGTDFTGGLSEAADRCRSYVSRRGFIETGELQPPDARYVMASEIVEIADVFTQPMRREVGESERNYVVDLVRGLRAGEPPEDRPESLDAAHNMALARTAERYIRDLRRYARSEGIDVPQGVEKAREALKRTEATEGDADDAVEALRVLRDVHEEVTSQG